MTDQRAIVIGLCREFGIEVIPAYRYPDIGQTRAVETMERILRRYGEAHLRLVLVTLTETANNKAAMDKVGLWATSDLLLAWSGFVEQRMGDWLEAWDQFPIGPLQACNAGLIGISPQRGALVGQVHERLYGLYGPDAAQPNLFDDRRRQA